MTLSSEFLHLSSKYGLQHSFVDQNKFVKQNIAVEMESVAVRSSKYIDVFMIETIHEFFRYQQKYLVRKSYLKLLNSYKSNKIIILAVDKESCTVI